MNKLFAVVAILLLALAGTSAFAQGAPAPGGSPPPKLLSQALIDKFLNETPGLIKDFKALGDEYNAQGGAQAGGSPASLTNAFAAIRADERARAILVKHGWTQDYWQVYTAILFGYMASMMDQAAAQSQQPQMKQLGDQYRAMVNPADAALVAKNSDKIQKLFESMQNE